MNATLQIMSQIQEIRGTGDQAVGPDPLCEAFVETVKRLGKEPQTLIPATFLAVRRPHAPPPKLNLPHLCLYRRFTKSIHSSQSVARTDFPYSTTRTNVYR